MIGSGCSIDAPSCLADGRTMVEAIVNYACAKSEVNKVLEIKSLRFEKLIELFRNYLDENLRIIDYYGETVEPNLHHLFLAEQIKKGNFIMTTNFDFLLECALINSKVPVEKIIPVITKKDFTKFANPQKLSEEGKKAIYKIHGSTKNMISGEDTRETLLLQPYKRLDRARKAIMFSS
ncbi:MAG: SIR2 family protein [Promethearchaeota archaeon]